MQIKNKAIAILALTVLGFGSCKKLTDRNINPKQPTSATSDFIFGNAQKEFADYMSSANVNENVFRLYAQHWAQTTYFDESRYDINTRNISGNQWIGLYRETIKDLREAKKAVENDKLISDEAVRKSQLATIDAFECYAWFVLVSTFGDIPYTKAMDIENLQPSYDDDQAIFSDLLKRLTADIVVLNNGSTSFTQGDLLYGGDNAMWVKFASTLKFKIAMQLIDYPAMQAAALQAITDVKSDLITSSSDDAVFHYTSSTPNTNPVWVDLVQTGRRDFVAANTLMDKMKAINDPRIPYYFSLPINGSGIYKGGVYGTGNSSRSNSLPSSIVRAADNPGILLNSVEVHFLLAELAARGHAIVPGSAADHYEDGIRASFDQWGLSSDSADAYLLNPTVAYATAAGTWQQKIGTQFWMAMYNRGFDAWNNWRRLDYPVLNVPSGLSASDIPVRVTYPVLEQNINTQNYNAAAAAIGGDKVSTKLFWDTN